MYVYILKGCAPSTDPFFLLSLEWGRLGSCRGARRDGADIGAGVFRSIRSVRRSIWGARKNGASGRGSSRYLQRSIGSAQWSNWSARRKIWSAQRSNWSARRGMWSARGSIWSAKKLHLRVASCTYLHAFSYYFDVFRCIYVPQSGPQGGCLQPALVGRCRPLSGVRGFIHPL